MIGLVISNLAGSGAERVVLQIARMFEEKGHAVHVFLLENVIHLSVPENITIHALTEKRSFYKALGFVGDSVLGKKLIALINKVQIMGPLAKLWIDMTPCF